MTLARAAWEHQVVPDVAHIFGQAGQGPDQPSACEFALGESRGFQGDPQAFTGGGDGEKASIEAHTLRPGRREALDPPAMELPQEPLRAAQAKRRRAK